MRNAGILRVSYETVVASEMAFCTASLKYSSGLFYNKSIPIVRKSDGLSELTDRNKVKVFKKVVLGGGCLYTNMFHILSQERQGYYLQVIDSEQRNT